jgi:1-hydroxycarotenoid 3,4-desaturase
MSARLGPKGLAVKPFSTLWRALNGRFDDPRLVQLFGRYSTYTGASPFMAPATLMLIAHVELDGVWLVKGGMRELAQVMRRACEAKGVVIQTGAKVARIETDKGAARAVILENGERHSGDVVVVNADASAIGSGLFGRRSARRRSCEAGEALAVSDRMDAQGQNRRLPIGASLGLLRARLS